MRRPFVFIEGRVTGSPIRFQVEVPERHRRSAADLVDQAFAAKLGLAIPNETARLEMLCSSLNLEAAVAAFVDDRLVGISGYRFDHQKAFDRVDFRRLRMLTGLGAVRAAVVLHFLDTPATDSALRVEFIAVDASMRGQGIGSGLIRHLEQHGCNLGASIIELDVVDTNPEAHRLYHRLGFRDVRTESLPIPIGWMGFRAYTTMTKELQCTTS